MIELNNYLCEPRCLQELLWGARAEVEQVGRPQPQDPGVHFVSYLRKRAHMQELKKINSNYSTEGVTF